MTTLHAIQKGRKNHAAGVMAEDAVARKLASLGHAIIAQRWRAKSGELDLVSKLHDLLIFTEVKKSKSFCGAARALSPRQQDRIMAGVDEYLAHHALPQSTDLRIDVALVNATGEINVIENALMQ